MSIDWHVSDTINTFVAIGTIAMAIYSGRTIKESRKSIEAAQRSAQATEESVERMKDGLMPYIGLDIASTTGGFNLFVRNVGNGLAKIRLVTARVDIRFESVFGDAIPYSQGRADLSDSSNSKGQVSLIDFIVGSSEEFTFFIARDDNQFRPDKQFNWLSSLSVYYDDIYGRLYRSRMLYLWERIGDLYHFVPIGTENSAVCQLPIEPTSNFNIQDFKKIEGERPHIYRTDYRAFYRQSFIEKIRSSVIEGNKFTGNKSIIVKGVDIDWHGYPKFHVQIENQIPFILECSPDGEHGQGRYHIYEKSIILNSTRPYSDYGLIAEGNDGSSIQELYEKIVRVLMGKLVVSEENL